MATESQIIASQQNSKASTGPQSAEGLETSCRNSITHGLTTGTDYVRPHEHDIYEDFSTGFAVTLSPVGIVEETFANEIRSASWRLRRCSAIEFDLARAKTPDFAREEATLKSVDRARAHAHNVLRKAMAELSRLQTERRIRNEVLPEGTDIFTLGVSSSKEVIITRNNHERSKSTSAKAAADPPASFSKTPQTIQPEESGIARNSLCPCDSGQKYKRCCGVNAPPVLNKAA